MGKCLLLVCMALAALGDPANLQDGITRRDKITSETGGSLVYKFRTGDSVPRDLIVSLTPYSDLADPEVYMSESPHVGPDNHSFPKEPSSRGFSVSPSQILNNTNYYIRVDCEAACFYAITVASLEPIHLEVGSAINGDLLQDHDAAYHVAVNPEGAEDVVVTVTPTSMQMKLKVEIFPGNQTQTTSLPCSKSWHAGFVCLVDHPNESDYSVVVTAKSTVSYSIVSITQLMTQAQHSVELRAGVPEEGKVKEGGMKVFHFQFDRLNDTIVLALTAMSGDPDLYVRVGTAPTPDAKDFYSVSAGADTLVITKAAREEKNVQGGDYYVGVYGSRQSSFTLTVSFNVGTLVPLTPGVQQIGSVQDSDISLYYMEVPYTQDLNVTVTVLPSSGRPSFYVKLCTSPLKRCRLTVKELSSSDPALHYSGAHDTVRVPHSKNDCSTSSCKYIVAVVSADSTRAAYHIAGTYDDSTPHLLRSGRPSQMAMPAGGVRFFRYEVLNTTVIALTFQVTPVTGDPDLYVTRDMALTDYNTFEKRSTKSLNTPDSVIFTRGSDGDTLVGQYLVAVTSPLAYSFFTILATEKLPAYNTTVHLKLGHPQTDTLANGPDQHYRIFSFATQYTESTKKPIKLTLTPLAGAFDIYVDNSEDKLNKDTMVFSYIWKLTKMHEINRAYDLVIDTTDEDYKMQSKYLAVVVAKDFTENGTASFTLMYRSGHNAVQLQDDVAVRDEVDAKELRLYSFSLFEAHEDITILVTALSGDPDLYVSYQPGNTQPDNKNYDLASMGFAGEVMTLQWETLEQACKSLPCTLRMAVYGYSACVFEIKVLLRKDEPQNLPLGTPQRGQLSKTQYSYYYSTISREQDFQVHLQSIQGDADLYINIMDAMKVSTNVADWKRPNVNEYTNSSRSAGAYDRVYLTSEVLQQFCKRSCVILTGVYCSFNSCQYLLYHEQGGMQLVEGVTAQVTAAAKTYKYFRFYCDTADATIVITVTALNEAVPQVYVYRGQSVRADRDNYNWKLTPKHGEPLVLRPTDHQAMGKSMRDHFSVGVTSNQTISFSISVTFSKRPELLMSGVSVAGTTSANSTSYYSFYSGQTADISIRVTPTAGFVTLFAASHSADEGDPKMPSMKYYNWTSAATGNVHELYIKTSDPAFCVNCYIYIAVAAQRRNSTYRITATSVQHMTQLSNGIPVQGSVRRGDTVRYTFELLEKKSFDVSLVTLSGNADLYIGQQWNVSADSHIWKSDTKKQVDHIHVPTNDHRFEVGVYYIGVVGTKESAFSLTAHVRNSFIHLVSGWPQFYSMQSSTDPLLFDFKVNAGEKFACVLRSITRGFKPRVVLSFQSEDSVEDSIPTLEKHDTELDDFKFNEVRFSNNTGLAGKYNIGVYRPEGGNGVDTFQLACASESELITLKQTDSAFSSVDKEVPLRRFMVSVDNAGTLTVRVRMCSGRINLQVSKSYSETESSLFPVIHAHSELTSVVTNTTGPFYLTVVLLEDSPFFEGAGFEVSTVFQSADSQQKQQVLPGNDGLIDWKVNSLEHVSLQWWPPVLSNGKDVADAKYRVLMTESTDVTMNSVCGIRLGETNFLVQESAMTDSQLPFADVLVQAGKTVFINVIAEVQTDDNADFVAYSGVEVHFPATKGSTLSPRLIGVIVATAGVLLTLLLVYIYRYNKAQRRLEYELSDVRNVATISTEIPEAARRSRKDVVYSPLQLESSDA